MKIGISAIGRMKHGPERLLWERYFIQAKQSIKHVGLSQIIFVEGVESRAKHIEKRQKEESQTLIKNFPKCVTKVILDENGDLWDSMKLAEFIRIQRDNSARDIWFLIGGADGHHVDLIQDADFRLSFGRMTWPHQLVRILIVEQIYRAITILSGHPYHRQ